MFNTKEKTRDEIYRDEIASAHSDYRLAMKMESLAEPEFVEAAILKTNAAKQRYNELLKRYKKFSVSNQLCSD